ncbi:9-cis-epoxycarotenoid dioxygenase [Aspergillus ambiguus]|uniref:carotenoid oxygenase family protein n=1 Tax=Aspergillus ambiguus TaxID=176160 RepID=UPI003CCE07AB
MSGNGAGNPYLQGNYAPTSTTLLAESCQFEGIIPEEFLGGQYIRNGSNPLDVDSDRELHWFDGDGMLTGVYFKRTVEPPGVQPVFSNQYVLTDIHCATVHNKSLSPIIPSMTTMVNPKPARFHMLLQLLKTYAIAIASNLRLIACPIKRVGASNTNILYHDGRVLATNEIGPPMRISLPSLKTVGWFTGAKAEGEADTGDISEPFFGGKGIEGFYKEMTTAHPRVDPYTQELILFHSTFLPPFVHYSIVPAGCPLTASPRLNKPVPGLAAGKLMHDFGVSRRYTVLLDCPVSLDPSNFTYSRSAVEYDRTGRTRLGIFPRHCPEKIEWQDTDACIVMHTASTWDEDVPDGVRVHILLCRMNSLAPLYHMGGLEAPEHACARKPECRLYYYQLGPQITQQWALSTIPFEFPHVPRHLEMHAAQFIYGCSMRKGDFVDTNLTSVKIDCLVKVDVQRLIATGMSCPPSQIHGVVDQRTLDEIIATDHSEDSIKVFPLPVGWYAQECSFVPRHNGKTEDDGWLVTYVFDESQLDEYGQAGPDSRSELWVIDAVGMKDVVARVFLPQRVPYGMHGNWFSEEQIASQKPYERFRSL